jgi:hypothetical protein
VHDWDSLAWQPEAALVGAACGAFASASPPTLAPVESSAAFLAAYQGFRRRWFTPEEQEVAWAASSPAPGCWFSIPACSLRESPDAGFGETRQHWPTSRRTASALVGVQASACFRTVCGLPSRFTGNLKVEL